MVVTRMVGTVAFPARFTLVAAANPCPCGFAGDALRRCTCREDRLQTYQAKLTGPLLDRVDIRLVIPRLTKRELLGEQPGESSAAVRERVERARARQRRRYARFGLPNNGQLTGPLARREARISADARDLLASAVDLHALTGRGLRPHAQGLTDDRGPRGSGPRRTRSRRRGACVPLRLAGAGARACGLRIEPAVRGPRGRRVTARTRRTDERCSSCRRSAGSPRGASISLAVERGSAASTLAWIREGRAGSDERPGVRACPGPRCDRRCGQGVRGSPDHVGIGRLSQPAPTDP